MPVNKCATCGQCVHDDDDICLDESWLRSVGFSKIWDANHAIGVGVIVDDREIVLMIAPGWPFDLVFEPHGRCIINRLPCQPETRGAVRRLASALGIPLQEQART